MKKSKCFKRIIGMCIIGFVLFLGIYIPYCKYSIPDSIQITEGKVGTFQYNIPVTGEIKNKKIKMNQPFSITKNSIGNYKIKTKIFGAISLKDIQVNVVKDTKVIPSGKLVGVYVETQGALVLDTDYVTGIDHVDHKPVVGKLKKNDYILRVDQKEIHTKAELIEKVNASGGKALDLTIRRGKETFHVSVTPVKSISDRQYKLGVWVRDNTQGIGTMTFTIGKKFGGLGHGIYDMDTGTKMKIKGGYLMKPMIQTIQKGKNGTPGEIVGSIYYRESDFIGVIDKNTSYGIFGSLQKKEKGTSYSVGYKQDVKKGKAKIISYISGKREMYDIQIININQGNGDVSKGIELQITDKKLIKLTNGIVQGMSGSPIIQNGKFIGAVTHVFVDDPTRGYGVFAQTMLEKK